MHFPVELKQALTNWRVGVPTEIDNREVNVVQATTPKGGTVTLCFDAETGCSHGWSGFRPRRSDGS